MILVPIYIARIQLDLLLQGSLEKFQDSSLIWHCHRSENFEKLHYLSRLIITILNIWLGCGERLQFKHFSFKFFQHLGFFFFLASFVFFFDEILYLRKLYFFQPFCFVLIPIRYAYEEGFFLRPFLKVLDNTVNLMPLSKFHKVPQHLVPTQVIHLPKLFIVKLSFLIVNDFFKDFDGRWIFFFCQLLYYQLYQLFEAYPTYNHTSLEGTQLHGPKRLWSSDKYIVW